MTGYFIPANWFGSYLVFILFNVAYWGFVLAEFINIAVSRINSGGKRKDRGSFWVVIIGIFVSIFASFYSRALNFGSFMNDIQYLGIVMMVAGIIIRECAIFTLGKGFTVKVHVQEKGKLVTKGLYRYLRHPSYTGCFLTFIGMPLAIGTWVGLIPIVIVNLITYTYRMNVEERALIEAYGEEYKSYMKKTKRIIPGIY